MDKHFYPVPVGYFTIGTLLLATTITCGFPKPSRICLCDELNKVNQNSLPEKPQNYISMGGPINFDSTMTASGTALASVSPSAEFLESDVS
jgi:hypothetical protein